MKKMLPCCFWGYSLVPKSFWMNANFERDQDFITLENNGNYLSCDATGVVSVVTALTSSELWVPEKIGGKIAAFRSYNGGYLAINEDGSIDCVERTVEEGNHFHVIWSQATCNEDKPNYVILRDINGQYLAISAAGAYAHDAIDTEEVLMKGHFWDPAMSACNMVSEGTCDGKSNKGPSKVITDPIEQEQNGGKVITDTGKQQQQTQVITDTGKQEQNGGKVITDTGKQQQQTQVITDTGKQEQSGGKVITDTGKQEQVITEPPKQMQTQTQTQTQTGKVVAK